MPFLQMSDVYKKQDVYAVPLRGVVVDNLDPNKLFRVRVKIDGMWEDADITKYPWVAPENPVGTGGSPDSGSAHVPEIGSELIIKFPYKSPYFAFYTGYWQQKTTHQGMFFEDYPNSYGQRDSQGSYTKVNKAKGYTEERHYSGVNYRINKDASAEWRTPKSFSITADDNTTQIFMDMVAGILTMLAKTSIEVQGPLLHVTNDKVQFDIGSQLKNISGYKEENINGNSKSIVGGGRSESTVGNVNRAVGGSQSQMIAGREDAVASQGKKETVIMGDHEVKVLQGMLKHMTLSGMAQFGNPLANWILTQGGDGNYKSSGKTSMQVGAAFDMNAGAKASMIAAANFIIKGSMVLLNAGSAPVLTEMTDPLVDLITGAPTVGVPTVMAG